MPTKVCTVKAMVFPLVMYGCDSATTKKNWCFRVVVLEKNLESPLDCREIKPVSPKGNQPWLFIKRNDTEAESPTFWPPDVKSQHIGKRHWCCLTISSSAAPFSFCFQSFPALGSFPMSWLLTSVGQNIGASALASVLPMNIQGWFPHLLYASTSCLPYETVTSSRARTIAYVSFYTLYWRTQ